MKSVIRDFVNKEVEVRDKLKTTTDMLSYLLDKTLIQHFNLEEVSNSGKELVVRNKFGVTFVIKLDKRFYCSIVSVKFAEESEDFDGVGWSTLNNSTPNYFNLDYQETVNLLHNLNTFKNVVKDLENGFSNFFNDVGETFSLDKEDAEKADFYYNDTVLFEMISENFKVIVTQENLEVLLINPEKLKFFGKHSLNYFRILHAPISKYVKSISKYTLQKDLRDCYTKLNYLLKLGGDFDEATLEIPNILAYLSNLEGVWDNLEISNFSIGSIRLSVTNKAFTPKSLASSIVVYTSPLPENRLEVELYSLDKVTTFEYVTMKDFMKDFN